MALAITGQSVCADDGEGADARTTDADVPGSERRGVADRSGWGKPLHRPARWTLDSPDWQDKEKLNVNHDEYSSAGCGYRIPPPIIDGMACV